MGLTPVYLNKEEREKLIIFSKTGKHNAHLITRAKILLVLDRTGKKDHMRIKRTAESYGVSRQAVYNIISDFHNRKSIDDLLKRKERKSPAIQPKVVGDVEAHIIALACSETPKGHARWTVRLLADKAVELNYIDSISHTTIQKLLKKQNINLI